MSPKTPVTFNVVGDVLDEESGYSLAGAVEILEMAFLGTKAEENVENPL